MWRLYRQRVELDLDVTAQLHQPAVELDLVTVLGQHGRDLLAPHLVEARVDLIEVAEGRQQLGGGLVAHTGDARQVVGGVTTEGGQLHVALRCDAVALLDRRRGHLRELGDAAQGVEHRQFVADQLHRVTVAGHDVGVGAGGDGARCQGGQDVVSLDALDLDGGDVEGCEHLLDQADLWAELIGGLGPVGLVRRERCGAGGITAAIERHDDRVRLPVLEQLHQHRGEAVDGVGELSGRGAQGVGQRVEGAVGKGVPVEQQDGALSGHGKLLVAGGVRSLVSAVSSAAATYLHGCG